MSRFRRRQMLAAAVSGGGGSAVDVTVTFEVNDISSPTKLYAGNPGYLDYDLAYMVIDGVQIAPVAEYQFATTGPHTVGYKQNYASGPEPVGRFSFARTINDGSFRISKIIVSDTITELQQDSGSMNVIGVSSGVNCDVELPNTLISIADGIFRYAYGIRNINIPAAVTTLGAYTFDLTRNIVIHIEGDTPPTVYSTTFRTTENQRIYVGDGSSAAHDDAILAAYLADSAWSAYSSILGTWYDYNNG